MQYKFYPAFAFALAFWASCTPEPKDLFIEGWKPVYLPTRDANEISGIDSLALGETGKIYTKGNYVYVGKPGWGVHVLDNSSHTLRNVAFLQIPGCNDISIKGDVLFADNQRDLVSIRLYATNPKQITVLKRVSDVFAAPMDKNFPPISGGYFECVDASKGLVGGWVRADLKNPKCRMNGFRE